MAEAGELFAGLDRFEARKKVVEQLELDGLLVEKQPYENAVGYSDRGDVVIEPRLSEQWFLKYPKVEEAKRVVEEGIVRFHPDRWRRPICIGLMESKTGALVASCGGGIVSQFGTVKVCRKRSSITVIKSMCMSPPSRPKI